MHKKQEFTTVKTKKALKLKKCQGILKPKPFQILQIYKNKTNICINNNYYYLFISQGQCTLNAMSQN